MEGTAILVGRACKEILLVARQANTAASPSMEAMESMRMRPRQVSFSSNA